jgi:hypothetical protein
LSVQPLRGDGNRQEGDLVTSYEPLVEELEVDLMSQLGRRLPGRERLR